MLNSFQYLLSVYAKATTRQGNSVIGSSILSDSVLPQPTLRHPRSAGITLLGQKTFSHLLMKVHLPAFAQKIVPNIPDPRTARMTVVWVLC